MSIALMLQTFEAFNDLCTKAHDIEIHLNKRKKSLKEIVVRRGYVYCSNNPAWQDLIYHRFILIYETISGATEGSK